MNFLLACYMSLNIHTLKKNKMNRNYIYILALSGTLLFASCGDDKKESTSTTAAETSTTNADDGLSTDPKGVGKHKNIQLTSPLDEAMVTKGKNIAEVKCTSCHKTNNEKLVGPGWAGVTDRRTPEWI